MPFQVFENKIPMSIASRVLAANAEWNNDEYQDFDALKKELVQHILQNAGPLNNAETPLPRKTTGYNMMVAGTKGIALSPKNDGCAHFVFDGSSGQVFYGRETVCLHGDYPTDVPVRFWMEMVFGNRQGF